MTPPPCTPLPPLQEVDFLDVVSRKHGRGPMRHFLELGAGPARHSLEVARRGGCHAPALDINQVRGEGGGEAFHLFRIFYMDQHVRGRLSSRSVGRESSREL